MIYEMRLKPGPFDRIVAGTKKIEFRLWDEKRQLINQGDQIIFTNTDTGKTISTCVEEMYLASSFEKLKEVLFKKNLIEETDFEPSAMFKYYSREEEEKYGVVGIEVKLLSN